MSAEQTKTEWARENELPFITYELFLHWWGNWGEHTIQLPMPLDSRIINQVPFTCITLKTKQINTKLEKIV